MALLMAAEGRVTVSERRSTTGGEGEEENRRRPRRHAVRRSEGAAGIIEIEFTDGRTMKITLYLEELEKMREREGERVFPYRKIIFVDRPTYLVHKSDHGT